MPAHCQRAAVRRHRGCRMPRPDDKGCRHKPAARRHPRSHPRSDATPRSSPPAVRTPLLVPRLVGSCRTWWARARLVGLRPQSWPHTPHHFRPITFCTHPLNAANSIAQASFSICLYLASMHCPYASACIVSAAPRRTDAPRQSKCPPPWQASAPAPGCADAPPWTAWRSPLWPMPRGAHNARVTCCLLYTSPSPRDRG